MEITLFTTDCPQCRVLEKKLEQAEIYFEKSYDVREVVEAGYLSAPILKVDKVYLPFADAITWINAQKEG